MMSGGGQSAGGSGTGGTVFELPYSAGANDIFAKQAQNLANTAFSGSEAVGKLGDPSAIAYPQAMEAVQLGLTQNPYADQAKNAAQRGFEQYSYDLFPQAIDASRNLYNMAYAGKPYGATALSQGFDPSFQQIAEQAGGDPYRSLALAGSSNAAEMGGGGAYNMQDMANRLGGSLDAQFGMRDKLMGTVDPLIQSGFDPQSALFNRSQSQLMDQTNAINAMSGLSGTPYGASAMAKAMSDFDIDWQNKQLARQVQGAGAAGNAAGAAGNAVAQAGNSATQAGSLYGQAAGLANTAAGLPSATYQKQLGNTLAALAARNQAGLQGAQGYGSLMDSFGAGIGRAQNMGAQGAQALGTLGAAPYNVGAGMANNALQGLSQQAGIGNEGFKLPLNVMNQMLSYLGRGQTASQLSGNLGQQGFDQTASGIGGLLGGVNTLFGANSLLGGSGGLFGAGGLPGLFTSIFSDRRLKTDIKRVGTLDNGLPVYLFRYKDGGDMLHMGLMADEVERLHPEAVVEREDGFKAVFYDQAVL